MSARLPARARLVVALLASAMAATACGSRLETGQLEAANGVLTRHANATGAGASVRTNGDAAWLNRGSTGRSTGGAGSSSLTDPRW